MEQSIEKISINFYDHKSYIMETRREQRTTSSLERVGTKVRKSCAKIFVAKSKGYLKCAEHQLGGIRQQVCKSQKEQRYRPDNHISAKISIFKIRKSLQNNNAFV